MAHFTCVGATVDELRATLDRMRERGHRERAGAARRPAAGPGRVDRDRGRPALLARADRADPRRLRLRDRRRVLPRDAHPRRPAPTTTCATRKEKVDAGRAVPDHAAVLRQPLLLRLRGAGARGRHRRADHPGHHADHQRRARSSGSRACAAPTIPDRLLQRAGRCAPTSPRRSPTSASPTRRCSAPTCWPTARPGIHFYTLNRSPATRAILSALRTLSPWRSASACGVGSMSSA